MKRYFLQEYDITQLRLLSSRGMNRILAYPWVYGLNRITGNYRSPKVSYDVFNTTSLYALRVYKL